MKKIIALVLAASLGLSLVACSPKNADGDTASKTHTTITKPDDTVTSEDSPSFEDLIDRLENSTKIDITENEDGTFTSYLGDGFKYEDKSESNIITLELDGLGFSGVGISVRHPSRHTELD